MQLRRTLFFICLLTLNTVALSQRSAKDFGKNSIGVIYVLKETQDNYHLKIAFHVLALPEYRVNYAVPFKPVIDTIHFAGNVTYFDQHGSLLTDHQSLKFRMQFWCDNDGGTQYRPEVEMVTRKKDFSRRLKPNPELKDIAGFVIINRDDDRLPDKPDFTISNNVGLTGDYNDDHEPDCFLWTYYDEAENCDNKPLNHLGIHLQVGKDHFAFRCCGP